MPRIKLFLMRHAKSCSNHIRSEESDSDPRVILSKGIRDPGLSILGARDARSYASLLRNHLRRQGFVLDRALIGASALRRAQDTAGIIFGRKPVVLPHFTENGKIPENTPAGLTYATPNWTRFIAHLSTLVTEEGQSVAVVGHGSFLLSLWPQLTGSERSARLNNLDGILLDADIGPSGLKIHSFTELLAPAAHLGDDKCSIQDTRKLSALHKSMTQRGGSNLPLAYVQDGAQMRGYSGTPTGVGLSGSWFRAPLHQTGGLRRRSTRRRSQKTRRSQKRRRSQNGGFSPSIMGAFAANGARLMPIAAFMSYKMYSSRK